MGQFIRVETHSGQPIPYKGARLVPFSQAVRLQIPGLPLGLTWNRPVSLLVVSEDGQERVLPIQDVTRMVVWALLGVAVFAWVWNRLRA